MIVDIEHLALKYRCEYCTAGPGFWCRTIKGAKATSLHYDRTDPIRLAWVDGWEEGKKDQAATYRRQMVTMNQESA